MARRIFFLVFVLVAIVSFVTCQTPSVALSSLGSSISLPLCRTWATYNRVASKQLSALASAGGDSGVGSCSSYTQKQIRGRVTYYLFLIYLCFSGQRAALQDTSPIGATDAPLSIVQQVKASSVLTLPIAIVGIAVGYNIPGASSLQLSPSLLAKIFMRKVTSWSDPQVIAENPTLNYNGM
jgi:ABC-type phosphate transport system substrate-binding protein